MLINSLLIFIEETLAIFILYAYISVWLTFYYPNAKFELCNKQHSTQNNKSLKKFRFGRQAYFILAIIFGLIFSITFTQIRPWLGMTMNGFGYEIFLMLVASTSIASILIAMTKSKLVNPQFCFSFALFLMVIPHASDLFVFLSSVTQSNMHAGAYAGMSIGLGICFSISYLLYFFFLHINNVLLYQFALSLFLSAQSSSIVVTLQQIDVLSSSLPLWNSNYLVEDKSEFGQFFKVLFGYDATPTLLYLAVLITFTFIILGFLVKSSVGHHTAHGVVQ